MEPVQIESMIYEIRGQKVMLDRDLAKLYQVETRTLNQAVKRNMKRFPEDFMFQLNSEEYEILMSQFVISSWGGTRKLPYAFTEQGLAMLSGLLNSDIAINVNIAIMRTFVSIRKQFYMTQHFNFELEAIKAKMERLERNDEDNLEAINDLSEDMRLEIDTIYQAIAALSVKEPSKQEPQRQKIGFKTSKDK
ncbi:MAG: ORF6N domain-containing protein [Bacteroidales bacterium]|nr:ORF6N domain-containing protein [Bacteroidales bacterium]